MSPDRRHREVWWVAFDPSAGGEERMCRRAVGAIFAFGLTNQRSAERDATARLYHTSRLARRQTTGAWRNRRHSFLVKMPNASRLCLSIP